MEKKEQMKRETADWIEEHWHQEKTFGSVEKQNQDALEFNMACKIQAMIRGKIERAAHKERMLEEADIKNLWAMPEVSVDAKDSFEAAEAAVSKCYFDHPYRGGFCTKFVMSLYLVPPRCFVCPLTSGDAAIFLSAQTRAAKKRVSKRRASLRPADMAAAAAAATVAFSSMKKGAKKGQAKQNAKESEVSASSPVTPMPPSPGTPKSGRGKGIRRAGQPRTLLGTAEEEEVLLVPHAETPSTTPSGVELDLVTPISAAPPGRGEVEESVLEEGDHEQTSEEEEVGSSEFAHSPAPALCPVVRIPSLSFSGAVVSCLQL